jgi:hypothetical protein
VERSTTGSFRGFARAIESGTVSRFGQNAAEELRRSSGELVARARGIEAAQERPNVCLEAEPRLNLFGDRIVAAAQAVSIVGATVERSAEAICAPLARGQAGGLAGAQAPRSLRNGTSALSENVSGRGAT